MAWVILEGFINNRLISSTNSFFSKCLWISYLLCYMNFRSTEIKQAWGLYIGYSPIISGKLVHISLSQSEIFCVLESFLSVKSMY